MMQFHKIIILKQKKIFRGKNTIFILYIYILFYFVIVYYHILPICDANIILYWQDYFFALRFIISRLHLTGYTIVAISIC